MLINFTNLYKKYNMNIRGIIHIGGHYGEEMQEYVDNGIKDIVVFEPLTKNFEILYGNIKDINANIIGHQLALGSSKGIATMNLSSNEAQSSSILKPKEHLTLHPHVTFNGTEEVEVRTLDSYKYKKYNFLNMDVQGYELEVLKGSKRTLEKIDYVYCEVNRAEVYENNAMIEEIDNYLSNYNFSRVETDWAGKLWGDALYIKNR
jgi:FkbM family methyltransferase